MTKKLTRKEQDEIAYAKNLKYVQEHGSPDYLLAPPLCNMVELIKQQLEIFGEEIKWARVNPSPIQTEVIAAMERALSELDALQQKYFLDEEEAAKQAVEVPAA